MRASAFRICPGLGLDSCRRPRATRIRAPNPSRISPPLVARHPRALEGRRPAVPTRLPRSDTARRSRRPRSSPLLVLTHDRVVVARLATDHPRPHLHPPRVNPLVAKYRGELDDKLSRLAELQARYETDGEEWRSERGARPPAPPAPRSTTTTPQTRPPRASRQPWQKHERERVRARAVAVRPGSLGQDPSLASPSFAREARRRGLRPRVVGFRPRGGGSCAGREARYLAARLRSRPRWNTTPTRSSVRGRICRGTRRSGRVVFGSSTT